MPHNCCVPLCTKSGHRIVDGKRVSFHSIPAKQSIRLQWIHAIRRDPGKVFKITRQTKVCSLHFTEDDFMKDPAGLSTKRTLLPNAVPSVFSWTSQTKFTPRQYETAETSDSEESEESANGPDMTKSFEET